MPMVVLKATLICPLKNVWEAITNVSECSWRRNIIRVEEGKNQFTEHRADGKSTKCIVTGKDLYRLWAYTYDNEEMEGCTLIRLRESDGKTMVNMMEIANSKNKEDPLKTQGEIRTKQTQYLTDLKKRLNCKEARRAPSL